MKTILLICGGGGTEHDISLTSSRFIKEQLSKVNGFQTKLVVIEPSGDRVDENGDLVELRKGGASLSS